MTEFPDALHGTILEKERGTYGYGARNCKARF